ncbi:MAG: hypothetical protein ACREAA_02085 [Candidatus Polarisedimenticolia bacterium]
MSDYLAHLAARALNVAPLVRPRQASLFEPVQAAGSWIAGSDSAPESDARRPESTPPAPDAIAVEPRTGALLAAPPTAAPSAPLLPTPQRHTTAEASLVPTPRRHHEASAQADPLAIQAPLVTAAWLPSHEHSGSRRGNHEEEAPVRSDRDPVPPPRQEEQAENARDELRAWSRRTEERLSRLEGGRPQPRAPIPGRAKGESRPGTTVLHPHVTTPSRPQTRIADESAADSPQPHPAIQVTIGRVEVRAVAPAPPPSRRKPPAPRPGVTLEEYLRQRGGGRS